MGAVIPAELVDRLRRKLDIRDFVETGTYYGATAGRMARLFDRVWTIELSPELQAKARASLRDHANITLLGGDSATVLPPLLQELRKPALFWLDAHWSAGVTAHGGRECPLLLEIAAIRKDSSRHVVLIDDARSFLAPPPPPHRRDDWPTIAQVLDALRSPRPEPYIVVLSDVIVAVPTEAGPAVDAYWREVLGAQRPSAAADLWSFLRRRLKQPIRRLLNRSTIRSG